MNPLRKRLEQSDWLASVIGWIIAQWLKFCFATTRWDRRGDEDVTAALKNGPVMVVLWHEHIMMAALCWKPEWRPAAILTDTSPAARVAGAVQHYLDMSPFAISSKMSNLTVAREVLKLIKSGAALGITGDGPRGPARQLKDAPVEWAKVTRVPVFAYAFAMRRQVRLESWDRLVVPLPFTRGASVYRRWPTEVSRRSGIEEMATLRADLQQFVDAATKEAENAVRNF